MSASLKILGLLTMSIAAIVGITLGVAMWAVQTWAPPMAPVLYLGSALLGVFVCIGAVWFFVTREEMSRGIGADGVSVEDRALQRLVVITGEVLLGIVALGVAATWALDTVRVNFVDQRDSHVQFENVLEDPSPIVRLRACEELFKRGWVYRSKNPLIAALDSQPAVAAKCLETAKENDWKGVQLIASDFNDGWTAAMMRSSDADAASVCELAPWSPVMADLSDQAPEPRLLHCATGAASDAVRQCCATTLASRGKLLNLLGEPTEFPDEAASMVFRNLVKYGFQPLTLSATQQQVATALGTDDESVRQWVVEVGCDMIDPGESQPEILGGMMTLVEADSCNLSSAEETEYTAPQAWVRLCEHVFSGDSKVPVQQRICLGVQAARVGKAGDIAKMRVHEAVRAPFLQRDAAFIETGLNAAARVGGGGSKAREKVEFGQRNAADALGLTKMSDHTCRRMTFNPDSMPTSQGDFQVRETFDCDQVRDDMTVAEYRRKNPPKTMQGLLRTLANPFGDDRVKAAQKMKGGDRAVGSAKSRLTKASKDNK